MIIKTTVTDSPIQLHVAANNNARNIRGETCFCKDCFSQNANKFPNKNANVIESRNQASVGLTLLSSKVSCLSSPQTPLQCRCLILCFSSHGRLIRSHWTLYYRPIRVPDSFTFGCPAPRLGLTLARLAACLPATLAFAQLRLCCFGPSCPFLAQDSSSCGGTPSVESGVSNLFLQNRFLKVPSTLILNIP